MGVEVTPNSFKMPSRQPVFSKLGRILEPTSGEAEHQAGPMDPKSLFQDSRPMGISDLQDFFFYLKGGTLYTPFYWEKGGLMPNYPPSLPPQKHIATKAPRGTDTIWQ